jgi:hypothetical protein
LAAWTRAVSDLALLQSLASVANAVAESAFEPRPELPAALLICRRDCRIGLLPKAFRNSARVLAEHLKLHPEDTGRPIDWTIFHIQLVKAPEPRSRGIFLGGGREIN